MLVRLASFSEAEEDSLDRDLEQKNPLAIMRVEDAGESLQSQRTLNIRAVCSVRTEGLLWIACFLRAFSHSSFREGRYLWERVHFSGTFGMSCIVPRRLYLAWNNHLSNLMVTPPGPNPRAYRYAARIARLPHAASLSARINQLLTSLHLQLPVCLYQAW